MDARAGHAVDMRVNFYSIEKRFEKTGDWLTERLLHLLYHDTNYIDSKMGELVELIPSHRNLKSIEVVIIQVENQREVSTLLSLLIHMRCN
jgi:hypothetical protein